MLPQVVSLLNVSFLPEERGRAFGSYVVTIGLASILGQVLGGLLLAANIWGLNWRSIFLVNIPIGLVAFMAAWFLVHELRVPSAGRLDVGGVALFYVALFLLIYPLTKGSSQSWSFWSILSLGAALFLLAVFLRYEQRLPLRGGVPLVPLSLFKSLSFVAGVLSIFLNQLLSAAILLTLAFYLQDGLQYLPWQSGLVVMVMGIAFLLASSVSANVGRRLGTRALHLGAALVTLGYVVALLAAQVFVPLYGIVPLLVGLFVISSGNGTLSPLVINKALSEIDGSMAGAASGVYSTIQQVANALSVALIGTLFAVLLARHASQTQAFVLLLLVSAGLSFTAFLFLKPKKVQT